MTPIAQPLRKWWKNQLHQTKSFCTTKETPDWSDLTNYTSDKALIRRIHRNSKTHWINTKKNWIDNSQKQYKRPINTWRNVQHPWS
jgi:hypothetical protein